MSDQNGRVQELFERIVALPRDQRQAALDACPDPAVRRDVQALLDAHDAASQFLSSPTAATASRFAPITETAGQRIGPYKLLQLIGEGGFGTVFLADQAEPVRRRVALKIIKLGMDTKQVVARFEAERQALAIMDHPHIARVLDGGATPLTSEGGGRPYFVMEYVVGDPITEFAEAHKLPLRARLELFSQVCAAVQHAHTKGVIHRDIKPANVLVSMVDGKPFAKVIDFGIAKATAHLTDKTLFTEHRQLIGTPEYMSPEQAEGSPDIDTRADVYALGVLLYELLTGATPFDPKRLRSAAWAEMQRIIKEEDPPTPSAQVTQRLIRARSASKGDHTKTPQPFRSALPHPTAHPESPRPDQLRGELDWIVMKAMDKDRVRRHTTAQVLLEDISKHLNGEPVIAAPPSLRYRVQKFAKRNRVPLVVISAVAATAALGLVAVIYQAMAASKSAIAEKVAQEVASIKKKEAEAATADSIAASKRAEAINEYISDFITHLSAGYSEYEKTVRDRIVQDRLLRVEDGKISQYPSECVEMYKRIAAMLVTWDDEEQAQSVAIKCIEMCRKLQNDKNSENLVKSLEDYIELRCKLDYDGSHVRKMEVPSLLEWHRFVPAEYRYKYLTFNWHPSFFHKKSEAIEVEPMCRESLALRMRLENNELDISRCMKRLAYVLLLCGRDVEAESYYSQAFDLQIKYGAQDDRAVAELASDLAVMRMRLENYELAEDACRVALERWEKCGDDWTWAACFTLSNIGFIHHVRGRNADAEDWYQKAIDRHQRYDENNWFRRAQLLTDLSAAKFWQGKIAEAESLIAKTLTGQFPPSLEVSRRFENMAYLKEKSGKYDDAEIMYIAAIEACQEINEYEIEYSVDIDIAINLSHLALCVTKLGRVAEAREYAERSVAIIASVVAADDPFRLECEQTLASVLNGSAAQEMEGKPSR